MTILSNRLFAGEIPRSPTDKLPADNAQATTNCNFAYGELRAMKAPFAVTRLANAAKSIFSLDGLTFYSWPFRTKAWKGPVIGDAYDRMYFTDQNGGMRVARTTGTRIDGGEPGTNYLVGVPPVVGAPTFTLVDRTTVPDYPQAAIRLYSYYESGGKRYEEKEITTFTTVKAFREYTFDIAAPTGDTVAAVGVNALTASQRTVKLASYTLESNIGDSVDAGNQDYEVVGSRTLRVNNTDITNVVSMTPSDAGPITPGEWLDRRLAQLGTTTPDTASPSVRADVVDGTTGTTVFTLSASSSVASSRSDAVPGGVEAQLVRVTGTPPVWKLTLNYGPVDTRAYVVTMVNDYMEESKPSPPVLVSPTYMQIVRLSFGAPSFAGYVPCSRFRMYRSIGTGDYLSITDSPQTFSSPSITVDDSSVTVKSTDASLSSIGWDMPPAGLKGLTLLPNGFFAGFVGDTLYFSEPFRPWAWPYSMTFPVALVGMRAIENSLVVTTYTYPYLVTGVHPESMTQAQLTASQAGISDHGMATVGNTVAYISNDGLAIISGYTVDLSVGQRLWTREVWKEKFGAVLSDLELAYHDGALVCGCPTLGKMWEIRLDGEGGGNLSSLNLFANSLYVLPRSDQLYLVQGNDLYQYKGGPALLEYDWWGKDYILPKPTTFTVGYINCTGTVTVTLYANGVQRHQQTFGGASYFRIPSGSKALRWSYRLSGSGTVKEMSFAERRAELRNV